MRGTALTILVISTTWYLRAQPATTEIDSLKQILNTSITDSARAMVLAELAYRYYTVPDSSYAIAMRGLELSVRNNFARGVAANQYSLATTYTYIADYSAAMENLSKAFEWESAHGTLRGQARCYMSMGTTLGQQGDIEEAIRVTVKGYKLFQEAGDLDGMLLTLNNVGYLHTLLEHYDSAQQYLMEGLSLASGASVARTVELTGSLAELYLKKKNFGNARKYITMSIGLNESLDQRLQAYNYLLLAKIQLSGNEIKNAQASLHKAISFAKAVGTKHEQAEAYKILSDISLKSKDFRLAFDYYKLSTELKNEVMSDQVNKERQLLKHQFMTSEREARITILEQDKILSENELAQVRYKNQISNFRFWLVVLVAVLSLSMLAIFIISLRSRMRKERFKLWQREQVLAHEFAVRLANSELIALKAQMNPHFIFNSLNSINRYIIKSDVIRASDYLTKFSKLIRLILENSMTLRVPLEKELYAVELYLQMEALRFDQKFCYTITVSEQVDTTTTEVFPLIMQPYVENAIWHGLMHKKEGKGYIQIKVEAEKNSLYYTIEDNGIGREKASLISTRKRSGKKSFGLQITHERLKLLATDQQEDAASVNIVDLKDEQGEGCGTRVIIKIPISKMSGELGDQFQPESASLV